MAHFFGRTELAKTSKYDFDYYFISKTLHVLHHNICGFSFYIFWIFLFFFRTNVNYTQEVIMSKLDRRRKGVFGPAMGKKFIIFIDALNLPQRDVSGSIPPVELLRQVELNSSFLTLKIFAQCTQIETWMSLFMSRRATLQLHVFIKVRILFVSLPKC